MQGAQPSRLVPPGWVVELASARRFGERDLRGTLNLVDAAARRRAVAAIRTGETVSLARPLRGDDPFTASGRPGVAHEVDYRTTPNGMGWGGDHLELDAHGLANTHVDALNHVAIDGTFYGGREVGDPTQGSIDALAPTGIVARAVYVNVPAFRRTAWASAPVTGDDLDGALAEASCVLQAGDALLLDMGRDQYERSTGHMLGDPVGPDDPGGGLGPEGARWVAERGVAVLAWDMLDSRDAKLTGASAHVLTWAIGLVLVDNCDFAALRREMDGASGEVGALVVLPLPVEGANGATVNPVVLR